MLRWTRDAGHANASEARPYVDHTTNTTDGYYLHVDMSDSYEQDGFYTPWMSGAANISLAFYEQITGKSGLDKANCFSVEKETRDGNDTTVVEWLYSSEMRDDWSPKIYYFQELNEFRLYWRAKRGSEKLGDIAVDDIEIRAQKIFAEGCNMTDSSFQLNDTIYVNWSVKYRSAYADCVWACLSNALCAGISYTAEGECRLHSTGTTDDTYHSPGTISSLMSCVTGYCEGDVINGTCTRCAPGTFSDRKKALGACKPCPQGTYTDTTGSVECKECYWRTDHVTCKGQGLVTGWLLLILSVVFSVGVL